MSKKLDKIITNAIMLSIKITCCCPYVARTELHVMQSVFVLHAAAAAAAAFQSNHSTSHAVAHSFPVALVTQPHNHTHTQTQSPSQRANKQLFMVAQAILLLSSSSATATATAKVEEVPEDEAQRSLILKYLGNCVHSATLLKRKVEIKERLSSLVRISWIRKRVSGYRI